MTACSILGLASICALLITVSGSRIHVSRKTLEAAQDPEATEETEQTEEMHELSFEALSRVRVPELTAAGFLTEVAESVVSNFGDGKGSERGLTREAWEPITGAVTVFDAACRTGCKPSTARLRYDEWLKLKPVDTYKPPGDMPPEMDALVLTEEAEINEFLRKQGYNKQKAGRLAKDVSMVALKKVAENTKGKLHEFIQLDKDRDAYLSIPELIDFLGQHRSLQHSFYFPSSSNTSETIPDLEFDSLARIEAVDFSRAFKTSVPLLVKGIMRSAKGVAIPKTEYEEKDLQKVIQEFIRRDTMGPTQVHNDVKSARETDSFDGSLKFYQFAGTLPKLIQDGEIHINEEAVMIHVPTIEQVTGEKNRRELTSEDLERWLIKVHTHNANTFVGLFTGNKYQYAKKLADNVVTWADGSHDGIRNARISSGDEWSKTAGRLAIFLKLDADKDGKVLFDEAYPFLHKYLTAPEAEDEEIGDGPLDNSENTEYGAGSPAQELQQALEQTRNSLSGENVEEQESAAETLRAAMEKMRERISRNEALMHEAEELLQQMSQ